MVLQVSELGKRLTTVPDGEGERPSGRPGRDSWVVEMLELRAADPRYKVWRRSRMSEPRPLRPLLDPPRCTPIGHKVTAESILLPYAADAAESLPIFDEILTDARPQYGIPDPANVAGFFWLNPLKHYDAEADAAVREVEAILALTDRAVFQLEMPLQTVAVAKMPRSLQTKMATKWAKQVCEFIARTPEGSTWILHLCYGNKNDAPLVSPPDAGPLVELVNALWANWPHGRILDAVHLPFGDRFHPTPYSLNFYFPMSELAIPETVHVSAGYVRANVGPDDETWGTQLEQHRWAQDAIEQMANRGLLGVSTSCGWRRRPGASLVTVRLLAAVADF